MAAVVILFGGGFLLSSSSTLLSIILSGETGTGTGTGTGTETGTGTGTGTETGTETETETETEGASGGCEGEWKEWTPCSRSCGGGTTGRKWKVTKDTNYNSCTDYEKYDKRENKPCNTHACAECEGNWSSWSICNAPCDGGTQYRKWIVNKPAEDGGSCPNENARQINDCNVHSCDAPRPSEDEIVDLAPASS